MSVINQMARLRRDMEWMVKRAESKAWSAGYAEGKAATTGAASGKRVIGEWESVALGKKYTDKPEGIALGLGEAKGDQWDQGFRFAEDEIAKALGFDDLEGMDCSVRDTVASMKEELEELRRDKALLNWVGDNVAYSKSKIAPDLIEVTFFVTKHEYKAHMAGGFRALIETLRSRSDEEEEDDE